MVQIKITRAMIIIDGSPELWIVDEDGVTMMCLLDNGWLLLEVQGEATTFYPPHMVLWAEGVV